MSFLDGWFGKDSEEDVAVKLEQLLSSRDETIAVLEPATSGLVGYRLSNQELSSKVLSGSFVPSSKQSYEQFISLDEVQGFPHKQVANDHDTQLLANTVREFMGSNHGLSVIAPQDGTSRQTVFVGLNILGEQRGVYSEEMDFREDDIEKKISEYALRCFLKEYSN